MLVYYLLFLPVVFFAWLSIQHQTSIQGAPDSVKDSKPRPFFYFLSGLTATCILGFREGVGADYYRIYAQGYSDAAHGIESRYELAFDLLQQLCLLFSDDYHVLFFLSAAITVAIVYYAIYKWSKNPVLSIIIFLLCGLFFFSTNALRQAIAIAIFIYAVPYISKGDWQKYCVLLLVATLFHQSAIVLILLYFVRYFKLSLSKAVIICLVVAIFGGAFVDAVIQIGSLLSEQFAIYARLEHYLEGDLDMLDLGYTFIAFAIFKYVQLKDKKIYIDNADIRALTNILFVGLLVTIMTNYIFILFRFARYFTPLLILYIPNLVDSIQTQRKKRVLSLAIIICFIITSFIVYGYLEIDQAVPYQTYLFD